MQPTIVACVYAPEGYEKFLIFFVPPSIEQRVLAILRQVEAIDNLYYFPDECTIPTPIADMKIIMATIDESCSTKQAAETVKAKMMWVNVTFGTAEMEAQWATRYAELIKLANRISNVK